MSEARKARAIFAGPGIPGLLWLTLAGSYLATSASGQRGIALGIVGLMIGVLVAARGRPIAGGITSLVLLSACLYWSDSLALVVYLPPLAGFAFMAFFFYRTLRRGSEPLIARVARKEHADLPAEIARYTRILTWVWSGCFVILLAAALVLAAILPLHSWSRWVQVLGVAVPVALFLGEYVYRHHRLRGHRHASLLVLILNSIQVVREAVVRPVSRRHVDIERP